MDNSEAKLTPFEMIATVAAIVSDKPATHDDCVNLRKLQAQVNQAVYDLCETCQPVAINVEINPNDSGINL